MPGTIVALASSLVIRLALPGSERAESLLSTLETPVVFAAVALVVGLILYLVDFPMKMRIAGGDARRGFPLPSKELGLHLRGTPLENSEMSLYFILSDQYLPPDLHRRVYLFGSLYRVFVDLRIVLILATVVGPALALATTSRDVDLSAMPGLDGRALAAVLLLVGSALAVGLVGIRSHAANFLRKHGAVVDYLRQVREQAGAISVLALTLTLLGALSTLLLATGEPAPQMMGIAPLLIAVALWLSVEIGPPTEEPSRVSWRSGLLRLLRASYEDPQYSPLQRLLADLGLVLPWIVASSLATWNQGADPERILLWGVFLLPGVAIMSVRKHEVRLLTAYRDQCVWLDLHADRIKVIAKELRLPDAWN